MKKNEPWGLIIVDDQLKKFAFTGIITNDELWNERICEEQKKGRQIRCFSHQPKNNQSLQEWASSNKFSEVTIEEILSPPEDISMVYNKNLPDYASKANRKRIVKIICRGKCLKTRWAELNSDFPGKDLLRKASMGTFKATCLKCGYIASDNYNWIRE